MRWRGAGEGAAVLHGNRLMDEVMGLAGHQTEAGCEWRPCPDAAWLIVFPRESPGRPFLSH